MGNQLSYPEVDLSGKVAMVTGGNTGIGYETAKALARLGAHTFIACRSKERAEKAIINMKYGIVQYGKSPVDISSAGNENKEAVGQKATTIRGKEVKIEYLPLDLSSFQATKECVRLFKEKDLPLHILINNAGVAAPPHSVTDDGIETQFQINHLGPMLLTLELLPVLIQTASSSGDVRVVFLTTDGHARGDFKPDALNVLNAEEYGRMGTYLNTKLYNVMTGYYLQRRLPNRNITFSSAHPGFVNTEISRNVQDWKSSFLFNIASSTFGRTCVEGAATSLNCAVNPELNSQQHCYYESCQARDSSEQSKNEQLQDQLWEKSMEFLKDHCSAEIWNEYRPSARDFVQQPLEVPVVADNKTGEVGEEDTHLPGSDQATGTPAKVDALENPDESSGDTSHANGSTQLEDVKADGEDTKDINKVSNAEDIKEASLNTENIEEVSNTEDVRESASKTEDIAEISSSNIEESNQVSNSENIKESSNSAKDIKETSEDISAATSQDASIKHQEDNQVSSVSEGASESQQSNGSTNNLQKDVTAETLHDTGEVNDSTVPKAPENVTSVETEN